MKNILTIFACGSLTILLIFSAGCSYISLGDSEEELVPITSIGVSPALSLNFLSTQTGTKEGLEAGIETMNSLLAEYFQDYQNINLISQNEIEGLSLGESGRLLSLAREVGQQLHYDAVLLTSVERYQAREGSEYAVINPASVAFSLRLLAVESGQVVWSADFDQTQQPLFENILKSRSTGSGFRWLSAAELASAGLTKKLNNCPYLKRD
jgi:hypothetical protein